MSPIAPRAVHRRTLRRRHGRIDAVVNNAMLLRYEPIENVTGRPDAHGLIGINGAVWGTQALLAHLDPARGGAIINMASPVAGRGYPIPRPTVW